MIDSRKIEDLFAPVARLAKALQQRMKENGYEMGISSTYRDSEYQNMLYAKGRTAPGAIVTNVRGGSSMHNYRLAFDVFQNIKGKEYDLAFLNLAGKIGMQLGLEWGGMWKDFVDRPHFQWTGGLILQDLQKGKYPNDTIFEWEKTPPSNETCKVDTTNMKINGTVYVVSRIFLNDKNYVELQSLKQCPELKIGYDAKEKMPLLETFEKK